MKKNLIFGAIGILFGWIISSWMNSPGKYQVITVIHPDTHIMQSCLLDSKSGRIRRLYNFDNNLMFGKPEPSIKQWERWQESRTKYETSRTNTPAK